MKNILLIFLLIPIISNAQGNYLTVSAGIGYNSIAMNSALSADNARGSFGPAFMLKYRHQGKRGISISADVLMASMRQENKVVLTSNGINPTAEYNYKTKLASPGIMIGSTVSKSFAHFNAGASAGLALFPNKETTSYENIDGKRVAKEYTTTNAAGIYLGASAGYTGALSKNIVWGVDATARYLSMSCKAGQYIAKQHYSLIYGAVMLSIGVKL